MSKSPVFSFVIPVYKKPPEVFSRCIESLLDMSMQDIEIICVFDGPNEELQAIAGKYKKVISKVIEHGGAPKARNAGLDMATGEYVVAWDADCYAKPEMAKRWLLEFQETKADFVYSGYEFTNERGRVDSEPFDFYSLQCGNYISSMAPIKREKAPRWDEELKAAQDWDYWLTAAENGCVGAFIPGEGFITEPSFEGSISHEGWSSENREKTIDIVRKKHNIPDREIGVFSMNHSERALKFAKILDADVIKGSGRDPRKYRVVFNFGYSFMSRYEGFPEDVVKIQYWLPGEIEGLSEAKYSTVSETIKISKNVLNFVNTSYEKNKLSELGIESKVLPLPLHQDDLKNVQNELPSEFSILVLADEAYGKLLKELPQDLPHIRFGIGGGKAKDYSCVLSFYRFAALDDALNMALVNGRNVISNVAAPYCGFIDPQLTWDEFKTNLYEKIRDSRNLPFNKKAQDYYLGLVSPERFREKIHSLLPQKELV